MVRFGTRCGTHASRSSTCTTESSQHDGGTRWSPPQVPTGADALSHVADAFRLKGTLSAVVGKSGEWGTARPAAITSDCFRGDARTAAVRALGGGEPIELAGGDVVAMTRGLCSRCAARRRRGGRVLRHHGAHGAREPRRPARGDRVRRDALRSRGRLLEPAAPAAAAHSRRGQRRPRRALVRTHRAADRGRARRIRPAARRCSTVSREIVFVQLVRAWARRCPKAGGWLRALNDPRSPPRSRRSTRARASRGRRSRSPRTHLSRSAFAAKFARPWETPLGRTTRAGACCRRRS